MFMAYYILSKKFPHDRLFFECSNTKCDKKINKLLIIYLQSNTFWKTELYETNNKDSANNIPVFCFVFLNSISHHTSS